MEQDLNCLDAQREARAAYVKSQTSEGWRALTERYDHGGVLGRNNGPPGAPAPA